MDAGTQDRKYWVEVLRKISYPVLNALAEKQLKATMPVEGVGDQRHDRSHFSHLEALARTLMGIAPWLECAAVSGEEKELRDQFCRLSRAAIDAATDPDSPDYVNFSFSFQPIVDSAFLAHAILRAPNELWGKLEDGVKRNLVAGLKATRTRKPHSNNWLLFSAMIEATLYRLGEDLDPMRIDYALKQHEQWYAGDGLYKDGIEFHWDYYNSFVIQPMLVDILQTVGDEYAEWKMMTPHVLQRAKRYGEILERLISPEGTFPPIGRSLAYRYSIQKFYKRFMMIQPIMQKY